MRRLKILYLAHRVPDPPDSGAKIRAYHTIRHLARDHEVSVAAPARSQAELAAAEGLRAQCHEFLSEVIPRPWDLGQMLLTLPTAAPASMGYFRSRRLVARVRRRCAETPFDVILVHSSSVAPYVADLSAGLKILDFVDMDSQKWLDYANHKPFPLSLGYGLEGRKLARAEARLAAAFDLCVCATGRELESLAALGGASPGEVVPNGVDLEYFAPNGTAYGEDAICFVGRMDYYPNAQSMVDFCERVLPRLQAARPGVSLTIVGAEPPASVRALARRPGVRVTGTVADVRPYVRASAASVAPLRIARGTQNKILESLAMGVPVVATPVAAGGVDVAPGRDLLVADAPEELAAALLGLLADSGRRRRYAEAGRRRVAERHSWPAAMRRFDRLIERGLDRRRP